MADIENSKPVTEPEKEPSADQSEAEPFVPYVTEAMQSESGKKKKRLLILVIVLIVLNVIIVTVTAIGRRHNFYERTMKSLSFDYRSGESVDDAVSLPHGDLARHIAEEIGSHKLTAHAVNYLIDGTGALDDTVISYDYTHSPDGDSLKAQTGVRGWIVKRNSEVSAEPGKVLSVYDFCFSVDSRPGVKFECIDGYETAVGRNIFDCELWLMEDSTDSRTMYYTLYRYYSGGRLAGVRVLTQLNNNMSVFDVTGYEIES